MSGSPSVAVEQVLRGLAPPGCLIERDDGFVLLTRAGPARVSVRDGTPTRRGQPIPYIQLFVRFEVPAVANLIHLPYSGQGLNRYTGKWNHLLDPSPEVAKRRVERLFETLWPSPTEIPWLEFLAAVNDMLSARWSELLRTPEKRKYLPIRRKCGHYPRCAYCDGCDTDYAAQDAREFWGAVSYFMYGVR